MQWPTYPYFLAINGFIGYIFKYTTCNIASIPFRPIAKGHKGGDCG